METPVRVDKWLWAVRLFKTRTLAAEACRNGHVVIDGQPAKPSRQVHPGMVLSAKVGEITRTVKVIGQVDRRVGARLVPQFLEDLTPRSEYEKPREVRFFQGVFRPKGSGRPTKKDRRDLDRLS